MALRIGQILRGNNWNYRLVETLGNRHVYSDVYKAELVPRGSSRLPGKWAVIKSGTKQNVLNMLKYEHTCYMNPAIRSSRYIRPMYESINGSSDAEKDDPFCLAFEWMDCTLKEVPSAAHKRNSVLHKRTAEAVLGGFAELHSQHLVHSDIKPDNILVSGLEKGCPVVKLGDLGLVRPEGFNDYPVQPIAMRAPEVWSGKGCFHSSDIWSFAVTLFDWIQPYIFGANDMPPDHWPGPWALGKLLRLFPDSVTPHPTDFDCRGFLKIARLIDGAGYTTSDPVCFELLCFEGELNKLDVQPQVREFLRYLFVVDYHKRPTARDVLNSRQFHLLDREFANGIPASLAPPSPEKLLSFM